MNVLADNITAIIRDKEIFCENKQVQYGTGLATFCSARSDRFGDRLGGIQHHYSRNAW